MSGVDSAVLTPLGSICKHVSVARRRARQREPTCSPKCGVELVFWPGDQVPHEAGSRAAALCGWCVRTFGEERG